MRGEKKSVARAISFLITAAVILLLVFSGPAQAFSISLDIPDTSTEKGGINVFTGEVNIQTGENLPIEYLELQLDGPENVNCKFNVNGSVISGCKGITIQQLDMAGYGYGYGYGYYGYGYSFGYGYGYTQGKLKYEFALNTSDYAAGEYETELKVAIDGKTFSEAGETITITEPPVVFGMTIFFTNETIYNTRRIQFNLTTTEEAEKIEYTDWNDKRIRWKLLCRECDEYGYVRKRTKTLNEGENNLTFRATNPVVEEEVRLFIDSRKPRIYDTKPRSGFANGLFSVEYREENPKELWLIYGNKTDERSAKVNLGTCYEERKNTVCNITVNLTEFDEQEIVYRFNMTDIADNYDKSRERKVKVDFTSPRINNLTVIIDRKSVSFTINISEKNFKEVAYIDQFEDDGKEKNLCSRLKYGICDKKRSFEEGEHNITVIARDEAGNEANRSVYFFIDSKKPRIYDTEPSRGFASGAFAVEYKEENPAELWLTYGNETDERSAKVNLGTCYEQGSKIRCDIGVNLTEFDEQKITYLFNITDIAGNYDESREKEIMVDFSKPRVNDFNYIQDSRKVTFVFNISEPNFDEINFIDNAKDRETWSLLCSVIRDGYCKKIKWFSRGEHNLTIEILDDAGNRETIKEVIFDV